MAARIGGIVRPTAELWYKPKEVWPIIACIGVAVGWTIYMSGRALMGPDVSIDKARRGNPVKSSYMEDEAERWVASHKKYVAKNPEEIRIFSSFERKY